MFLLLKEINIIDVAYSEPKQTNFWLEYKTKDWIKACIWENIWIQIEKVESIPENFELWKYNFENNNFILIDNQTTNGI